MGSRVLQCPHYENDEEKLWVIVEDRVENHGDKGDRGDIEPGSWIKRKG